MIAAGLSTTIGSCFVFCSSYANTRALAAALGVSAGVMLYVSFVEIFAIKAVEGFTAAYGDNGSTYATLCFFGGILATTLLDSLVHAIGRYQRDRCNKKAKDESGSESDESLDESFDTFDDKKNVRGSSLKQLRINNSNKNSSGKSPKHGTDPADMLAGERAMWSDAAAATQEENGCDEKEKRIDVETGGGSSASSTISAGGTPQKRPNAGLTSPGIESMHSCSQVELLTNVKHGVTNHIDTPDKEHLKNMGFMTALAIGLHNFPEGLATFVAALADMKLGIALAVAVAIHNIPEGACVAMPVYYATGSKWKGFWWSFVSGISEPIGGLFGYLVLYGNGMSDAAYGALFAIVGGMMVYISLKELLPTALKYDPHDQYVTNCMFGGMAVMALSLILFQI